MPYQPNLTGNRLFQPQLNSYWQGQIGANQPPPNTYQAPSLDQMFNMPGSQPQQAAAAGQQSTGQQFNPMLGGTAPTTLAEVMANLAIMNKRGGGVGR